MNQQQYREVAYIIARMAELIPDIQDQFEPDDDEKLANMIIHLSTKLGEAEAYALRKGLI